MRSTASLAPPNILSRPITSCRTTTGSRSITLVLRRARSVPGSITLARAEASATRATDLLQRRYQGGTASLLDVLDAQRQQILSRQALAEGQARLTNDYVALQKSLGLGWSEAVASVASKAS